MTFFFKAVAAFAAILFTCPIVGAQSIWQQHNPRFANFFHDSRAYDVGDLLTVVIDENTDVQKRDQRALDKSSDEAINFNFASASSGGTPTSASLNVAGDSSRAFDGNSQFRVAQAFSDRIAVRVVGVLPNGNLVISGIRRRVISDEVRELRLSGVVRPIDVFLDNSVRSSFVADLDIQYLSCGSESHFINHGWFGKALNRVWPF